MPEVKDVTTPESNPATTTAPEPAKAPVDVDAAEIGRIILESGFVLRKLGAGTVSLSIITSHSALDASKSLLMMLRATSQGRIIGMMSKSKGP